MERGLLCSQRLISDAFSAFWRSQGFQSIAEAPALCLGTKQREKLEAKDQCCGMGKLWTAVHLVRLTTVYKLNWWANEKQSKCFESVGECLTKANLLMTVITVSYLSVSIKLA